MATRGGGVVSHLQKGQCRSVFQTLGPYCTNIGHKCPKLGRKWQNIAKNRLETRQNRERNHHNIGVNRVNLGLLHHLTLAFIILLIYTPHVILVRVKPNITSADLYIEDIAGIPNGTNFNFTNGGYKLQDSDTAYNDTWTTESVETTTPMIETFGKTFRGIKESVGFKNPYYYYLAGKSAGIVATMLGVGIVMCVLSVTWYKQKATVADERQQERRRQAELLAAENGETETLTTGEATC